MESIRFKDFLIDYLECYHITKKEFASRIGISQKHLIELLAGKREFSAQIITNISLVTDIPVDYIYNIEKDYKLEQEIHRYLEKENLTLTKYLNKFCYRLLPKENYFEYKDESDKLEILKDILKFLRVTTPEKLYELNDTIFYKSKNNKPELLFLWLEKCYRTALTQKVSTYKKENIPILVQKIKELAKKNLFDEEKLIHLFNENGIYLVIQDDIKGSKIRGAFRVLCGVPAIYLTHKHQRIADIYFALLHELAHCKTDFNKAQAKNLISYENNNQEDSIDQQAYCFMVDDTYYKEICCKKNYDIKDEKNYPKSFIVYRLAQDGFIDYHSKEYQTYNPIIK